MDVVAVPSRFEGFGLSAAESMAAGRPVVGTNIEGLSEIIQDKVTGYLVPANDRSELAKGIIKLLDDPQMAKTMGSNGYQRVKEYFSMENFSKSWLSAYRNLKNAD